MDIARDFVGFTFVPSARGFNALNIGVQSIFDISPLNWVTTVATTWSSVSASFANTATVSLPHVSYVYRYSNNTATVSLDLFSATTVMYYFGSSWNTFYQLMVVSVWVGVGYYIYRRITNIV